jgi:hypothetical protein
MNKQIKENEEITEKNSMKWKTKNFLRSLDDQTNQIEAKYKIKKQKISMNCKITNIFEGIDAEKHTKKTKNYNIAKTVQ